jgi:hypothetical protein
MPLGGGSTWAHTHDSYFLLRADGTRWGILSTSVQRTDASLHLERCAVFHLESSSTEPDPGPPAVEWTYYHPSLRQGYLRRRWRADTPAAELVPHAEIRDGVVLARVEASPGAITVTEGDGVARVHMRLGIADAGWPPDSPRIELLSSGRVVVAVCLPTSASASVEWHATSMP